MNFYTFFGDIIEQEDLFKVKEGDVLYVKSLMFRQEIEEEIQYQEIKECKLFLSRQNRIWLWNICQRLLKNKSSWKRRIWVCYSTVTFLYKVILCFQAAHIGSHLRYLEANQRSKELEDACSWEDRKILHYVCSRLDSDNYYGIHLWIRSLSVFETEWCARWRLNESCDEAINWSSHILPLLTNRALRH